MDNLAYMYGLFLEGYSRSGKVFVLNHLRSEKGKSINGRRCVVVGSDTVVKKDPLGMRIHVRLLNPDTQKPEGREVLKIKPKNLIEPEVYCSVPSKASMPPQEVLRRLNLALQHAQEKGYDNAISESGGFRDRYPRCQFLSSHLPDNVPPRSECMDNMTPKMNKAEKIKAAVTPGCVGDGYVDFSRFGEGLVGENEDKCPICQEPLCSESFRLPCNHRFHTACAGSWLEENNTCPTCRAELTNPWTNYIFSNVDEQIQLRVEEWFLSGMCERCQAVYQENDPVVEVELEDGTKVAMQMSEATRRGETRYQRLQGESKGGLNILR